MSNVTEILYSRLEKTSGIAPRMAGKVAKTVGHGIKSAIPWAAGLYAYDRLSKPPHVDLDSRKDKVKRLGQHAVSFTAGTTGWAASDAALKRVPIMKRWTSRLETQRSAIKALRRSGKNPIMKRMALRSKLIGKGIIPLAAGFAAWDIAERVMKRAPGMKEKKEKIVNLEDLGVMKKQSAAVTPKKVKHVVSAAHRFFGSAGSKGGVSRIIKSSLGTGLKRAIPTSAIILGGAYALRKPGVHTGTKKDKWKTVGKTVAGTTAALSAGVVGERALKSYSKPYRKVLSATGHAVRKTTKTIKSPPRIMRKALRGGVRKGVAALPLAAYGAYRYLKYKREKNDEKK